MLRLIDLTREYDADGDPQRRVLMGDSGPFQACEAGEHNPPPELPVIAAPAGYWPSPEGDAE